MSGPEMIVALKEIGHLATAYHVTSFKCNRLMSDEKYHVVAVEIWDGGPAVKAEFRYLCVARVDGGAEILGEYAETIEKAIATVDWDKLVKPAPRGAGRVEQAGLTRMPIAQRGARSRPRLRLPESPHRGLTCSRFPYRPAPG